MNRFPRQIIIDFDMSTPYLEVLEQAIDEAMKDFDGNYNFELRDAGISMGFGTLNLAYFDVEYSKELDVRKLIYG